MKNIINKFLSAGDKYMPKMPWRQPGFMYTASGPVLVWTKKNRNKENNWRKGRLKTYLSKLLRESIFWNL